MPGKTNETAGSGARGQGTNGARSVNPFSAAGEYRRRGWNGTVPVAYEGKALLVKTFTGRTGGWPSDSQVSRRAAARGRENIALRLPRDVVGIDVDDYNDKHGAGTLEDLERRFGRLPATWASSSRHEDVSGIRFFRLDGVDVGDSDTWIEFPGIAGPGIEIIQFHHRYAIVWPSVHPSGNRYVWRGPDGSLGEIPAVDDPPALPAAWVAGLQVAGGGGASDKKGGSEAERSAVEALLSAGRGGEPCRWVASIGERLEAGASRASGAAHDSVRDAVLALVDALATGHRGVRRALSDGRRAFIAGIADRSNEAGAIGEWRRMVAGAVAIKAGRGIGPGDVEHVCVCDHPGKLDPFGAVVDDRPLGEITAEKVAREAEVTTIGGTARPTESVDADPFGDPGDEATALEHPRTATSAGDDEKAGPAGEGSGDGGTREDGDGEVDERIDTEWKAGQFTDRWLAEAFSYQVCTERFCWTSSNGWFAWNGKRWARCPDERVVEAVGRWARTKLARLVEGGTLSGAVFDAWKAVLTARRQNDVVRLSRGVCEVDGALFDQEADLLNCPNGVVDLRTGAVYEHSPRRLFTKMTKVAYVPGAVHSDWETALEALPADVRDWMRLRLGQALTGYMTPDDRLLVQHGGGKNGKSVFTSNIGHAMGSYYGLLSDRVLMATASDHPTELMDLQGLRLAVIEETPEARRLNVQRLKKTVGTPQITARRIRQDDVTFDATHSMVLSTNYKPSIEESDHGTWRRVLLVTFPYRFREPGAAIESGWDRRGDPTLRDRMKADMDGQQEAVLAWLVAGAQEFYAAGKVMPEVPQRVLDDTHEWQLESDVVMSYIEDRLEFSRDHHVPSADLAADMNVWLEGHGHKAWSARLVHSRLSGHDLFKAHSVEYIRIRKGASHAGEISRPNAEEVWGHMKAVPAVYRAWIGVTFKDPKPVDGDTDGSDSDDPFN